MTRIFLYRHRYVARPNPASFDCSGAQGVVIGLQSHTPCFMVLVWVWRDFISSMIVEPRPTLEARPDAALTNSAFSHGGLPHEPFEAR